ncbi:MAG: BlaI/MecI/CopY family transcriptional regulator [Gammaproteobacteria bacterium]|nr:BlaI/MecI/CopY family transcriptional regulator [Gammaproteobacteria bacterium]
MMDITKTEFEVLDALWHQHPASAADIVVQLNIEKPWHEKTVKTLLSRLVKKQAISFKKKQRHYLYSPLIEREAYRIRESQSLISRLFSGRITPLVAGFAKQEKLSTQDIADLKALIKQWEQDNA